jgi:Tol biopolymer transport system component
MRRACGALVGAVSALGVFAGLLSGAGAPATNLAETRVKCLSKSCPPLSVFISPTADRLVWIDRDGKVERLVVDEKPGKPFTKIWDYAVRFSPDGKHVACTAERDRDVFLVYDGKEMKITFFLERCFGFSPDSQHFVHPVWSNGNYVMACDGKILPGQEGTHVSGTTPRFSPDGKRIAFTVAFGRKYAIVCDGKRTPLSDGITEPAFHPDGKTLAYGIADGQAWWMINGTRREGPYEDLGRPVYSPDGKRLAYSAKRDKLWFMVCDGKPQKIFGDVGDPVFSPDSKRMAYAMSGVGSQCVVCDGEPGPSGEAVGHPVFSPNSKHLAYWFREQKLDSVMCDDKRSRSYTHVGWIGFSPDGEHLAYIVGRLGSTDELLRRLTEFHLVLDGVSGPTHRGISVPEHFADLSGVLRYVTSDWAAGEKQLCEAWLVEVEWPTGRDWSNGLSEQKK